MINLICLLLAKEFPPEMSHFGNSLDKGYTCLPLLLSFGKYQYPVIPQRVDRILFSEVLPGV
jgi:hypothetical protein